MLNRKDTKKRMAEENFRLLVESAPNALIKSDSKGTIVLVNKQAEKMFGYDREQFIGKNIDILVPHSISSHHHKNREYYNSQPESRYFGTGRDLHAIRGDGTEFPVEIGLNPITTERDSMVLASIIDTSERKKQENIITRQMIELQLKNKEMEQFNYIASHDLQEPLRTLSNYLLLIEEDHGNDLSDEYNLMKSDYNSVITKLEKQLGNTNFEKGDIEDLMGKGLNKLISLG